MQKVLILTYYWPPAGGAGVQRWLKFVKYMRQYGWEPVVYTAANGEMPVMDESLQKDVPDGITVLKTSIREPYGIYKRFIGRKKEDRINASFLSENKQPGLAEKISVWIRGNLFIPDARKFWIRPSIRYLSGYILQNNIGYVISSGPPHSMHMIGLGLKKKFPDIKWLADFRDPWTNIDFYERLMLSSWADKMHHRMELDVLLGSDAVISVGQYMSEEFKQMYLKAGGLHPDKFHVITNGFDSDDIPGTAPVKDRKFSLAHVGTLVKDRNPAVLWRVLGQLVKDKVPFREQLEIKLVGKVDIHVKEDIKKYGLDAFVKKIDYLPHEEVIAEQQRSRVLLLLVNKTKNAKGILTGKIFEYMASGSPVLAIGPPDGDLAGMIRRTGTGFVSGFEDEKKLMEHLLACFKGEIPVPDHKEISRYSRKELTRQLCDLLYKL